MVRVKGLRLRWSAAPGRPVFAGRVEVGRALRNLVTNAIRHTPPGGTIEVLGGEDRGMATVSVSDSCGGIPAEHLPRVFDVAFRGESARAPDTARSAGLGLSIARGIIEAHAGQIGVRNTGPGCQFTVRLPLISPTGVSPAEGRPPGTPRAQGTPETPGTDARVQPASAGPPT